MRVSTFPTHSRCPRCCTLCPLDLPTIPAPPQSPSLPLQLGIRLSPLSTGAAAAPAAAPWLVCHTHSVRTFPPALFAGEHPPVPLPMNASSAFAALHSRSSSFHPPSTPSLHLQVGIHLPPTQQALLLPPLLRALSPWLMCHTHSVRTFAQLMTLALVHHHPLNSPLWGMSEGAEGQCGVGSGVGRAVSGIEAASLAAGAPR